MKLNPCRGLLALLLSSCAYAEVPPIPVPADVAVTLVATPTSGLLPGEPIDLTLTVTNLGPQPVTNLIVRSSHIYDEIDLSHVTVDCSNMVLGVVDEATTFYYLYGWYIAGLPGTPPFAVGETRACHIRLTLTPQAPAVFAFSFGLPTYYVDINRGNDVGMISLQRAVATVPALSSTMLVLLTGLLALTATMVNRRLGSVSGRPG